MQILRIDVALTWNTLPQVDSAEKKAMIVSAYRGKSEYFIHIRASCFNTSE